MLLVYSSLATISQPGKDHLMRGQERRSRWHLQTLLAVGLLLLSAAQLLYVSHIFSASWDEPHHLFDGYEIWTQHDYRLNAEVPPLVKLAASLPLLGMHLNVPAPGHLSQAQEAFFRGRAFVFGNGGDRVLEPARMACMVFTLLLGLLLHLATYEMFGETAALVALALFVFDPNFLAHGTLVTTDVCSALCFFAVIYAFYRFCRVPGWQRLLATGVAVGLASVAKFTGVFLLPMLLLLVLAEALCLRSPRLLARRLAALVAINLCGWVILWSFYGFRYAAAPGGRSLQPALAPYLQSMPGRAESRGLQLVAHIHLLPEAYIWGLANTTITAYEDTSYFFGKVYRHGTWLYFPAAFAIKSTLPLLLLLLAAPLLIRRSRALQRRAFLFLLVPVATYFAIVMASSMDIGVRHLLPVYPFLYVIAGSTAAALVRRRGAWRVAVVCLVAWQGVTCLRAAPSYMAYGNEAWGGPSQVHRYLSDANVDWGQQLKAVKVYLDQRHITDCWFAYFPDGAIEPSDYGIPCRRLPTTDTLWWMKLPLETPPVISGTVLISDGDLEGIEFGDGPLNPYEGFRERKPNAVIQGGVAVYQGQFSIPLAAALYRAENARDLQKAGALQAAMQQARSAETLAPASVQVQLALGDVLAASGSREEALEHYRVALHLAETVRPELQADLLPHIKADIKAAEQGR